MALKTATEMNSNHENQHKTFTDYMIIFFVLEGTTWVAGTSTKTKMVKHRNFVIELRRQSAKHRLTSAQAHVQVNHILAYNICF